MEDGTHASKKQTALLVGAFALICGITIFNHEMWRDELHQWLISMEISSFSDLIANTKYESTPKLWFVLLALLTKISPSPVLMQGFCLAIGTAIAYVFVRHSPFTVTQKALFIFGYFPLYELSVIARPYGLSLLLSLIFCSLFTSNTRRPLLTSLVAFLLSQSSPMGLNLGALCGLLLLVDYVLNRKTLPSPSASLLGLSLVCLGVLVSLISMLKSADSSLFTKGFLFSLDFRKLYFILDKMLNAFLPIPVFDTRFWGTKLYRQFYILKVLAPVISIAIIVYCARALKHSARALILYLCGTGGFLLFFYVAHSAGLRHSGFFFVVFIMALWVFFTEKKPKRIPGKFFNITNILTIILSLHIVAAGVAVVQEWRFPFSNGKQTAEFIKKEQLDTMPMLVFPGPLAASITGYMRKGTKVFFPQMGKYSTFYEFHPKPLKEGALPVESVLEQARILADEEKRDLLLILNKPVEKNLETRYGLEKKAEFTDPIIAKREFFHIYIMSRKLP